MILELKKYPAKILLCPSQKINKIDREIKQLAQDMIETMYANNGCGLAAPQVGQALQLIIVDASGGTKKPLILINPKITKFSRKQAVIDEGCLSLPGLEVKVKRSWQIEVRAQNILGQEIKFTADGLSARIVQHEIDHLRGKLIINKINFLNRRRLIKQMVKNI